MLNELPEYSIFDFRPSPAILAALLAADDRLARLDERARLSGIRDGWAARLLYRNACAGIENRGSLVYLEDLVLLDGHAFGGAMSADLSEALATLKLWQRALRSDARDLLQNTMPGEADRALATMKPVSDAHGQDDAWPFDPEFNQAERLRRWHAVLQATEAMPPLIAAATVWDAWPCLGPEPQGPWRATLLAALTLAARGKVRGWLLPLECGAKDRRRLWRMDAGPEDRCLHFLAMAKAAISRAERELDALLLARNRMLHAVEAVSKRSHLPALVDLVMAKPLISISLVAKELGISKQAVAKLLPRLGSSLREVTERPRYRCWTVS